jgi:hypothetical protein
VYELHDTAEAAALRGGGGRSSSGAQIAAVPSLQHSVYLRYAASTAMALATGIEFAFSERFQKWTPVLGG